MKILLIQENGHHEANKHFRECYSLQRAFAHHGHNADVWGYGHDTFKKEPDFNSYDLIINLENYSTEWVPNLCNVATPYKILWSIDAHCRGEKIYNDMFSAGKYDLLLHSTRDFVKGKHTAWFPNSYDDDLIGKNDNTSKDHFIGFCGNYVNRKTLIDRLEKEFGIKKDIFVIGQDMVDAVNSYQIHFNKNISNDINYRSFETIGCGTLLCTNYNYQYEKLGFENLKNCIMYKSADELTNQLKLLKENPSLIEEISLNGLELAKSHTYKVRVGSLLKFLEINNLI